MTMTADDRTANGIWQFDYNGQRYTFTINPFFANAMQYGSTNIAPITSPASAQSSAIAVYDEGGVEVSGATSEVMPGASKKEYEIRSADQLQYLNWNCETKNVVTTLNTVCTLAICAGIFVGVNDCINDANGVNILIKTKTIVPIILNER